MTMPNAESTRRTPWPVWDLRPDQPRNREKTFGVLAGMAARREVLTGRPTSRAEVI